MSARSQRRLVVFTFGVPDFTGANRMAFEYMLALKARDVPVAAVCGTWSGSAGSVVEELNLVGIPFTTFSGWERTMDTGLVRCLANYLTTEKAGAVISFLQLDVKIAGWAAHSVGIPFIPCAQNSVTFGGNAVMRWIKKLAFRRTLIHCASRVYCCSQSVMDEYADRIGVPKRMLELLPNRIHTDRFQKLSAARVCAIRDSFKVNAPRRLILNVGRIDTQKGQDLLLDALSQMKNPGERLQVALIGGESSADPGGQFYQRILQETQALDYVSLAGWRDDIPEVLGSADIYVHPSRWEGLPLAVLEAMAAGLPVIYSDCAGHIEGFENGRHGYCVPSGDTTALVKALQDLSELPLNDLLKMGDAARQLAVELHDFRLSAELFCNEIRQLLEK